MASPDAVPGNGDERTAPARAAASMPELPVKARGGVYRMRPPWTPRYAPDVYVVADLGTLTGPVRGQHDPPVNLYWQPGLLDFASPGDRELFYSSALAAASTLKQFAQWVNGEALLAAWEHLSIPARVRHAWETIHPQLRGNGEYTVTERNKVQDAVLTVIAEFGFALAGGSALIDYDIVSRDTDDIDAFNDRWDVSAFDAAQEAIVEVCQSRGWPTEVVLREDFRRQIAIRMGGDSIIVDMVYYERSQTPEDRAGGGLRLIFGDVVGGKGVAVAESARGRDFFDLANIVSTDGWSLERVEESMAAIKYADTIEAFRASIARFRRGDFDDDIRKSGFDPGFCHSILG